MRKTRFNDAVTIIALWGFSFRYYLKNITACWQTYLSDGKTVFLFLDKIKLFKRILAISLLFHNLALHDPMDIASEEGLVYVCKKEEEG